MRVRYALAPVLMALVLSACGGASPSSPPTSQAPQGDLTGHTFVGNQVSVHGKPKQLVKGTTIHLTFSPNRITASAGCNQLSGTATWQDGTLHVPFLAMTQIGCPKPLVQQDAWLSRFLSSKPTWKHSDATLTLTSHGTVVTLTDQEVAMPDATLTGTMWHLTTTTDGDVASSVPSEVTSTLQFGDDGRVQVRPGCNTANGPYTADGEVVTFGVIGVTMMACPDPQMQVENTVLRALQGAVPFSIDGDQLTLRSTHEDSGQTVTLVYQAVADSEAS